MNLLNQPVAVGAAVYDVAMGPGTVVVVDDTLTYGITVKFQNGRSMGYSAAGHSPRFLQATLYWQNPVVEFPTNMENWRFRVVVAALASSIDATNGGS